MLSQIASSSETFTALTIQPAPDVTVGTHGHSSRGDDAGSFLDMVPLPFFQRKKKWKKKNQTRTNQSKAKWPISFLCQLPRVPPSPGISFSVLACTLQGAGNLSSPQPPGRAISSFRDYNVVRAGVTQKGRKINKQTPHHSHQHLLNNKEEK